MNDDEAARGRWRDLAAETGAALRWVEVRLDDPVEHRRRLETRRRGLPGAFPEPAWSAILARRAAFDAWEEPRIVLDAAHDASASVAAILRALDIAT